MREATRYLQLTEPTERTIVVGDIHGCFDEFQALLDDIDFRPTDQLVTVGDFMDRGPGSWELAKLFRDTPNAWSCLGNHERRVAGTVRGTSMPAWSQKLTLSQTNRENAEDFAAYLESLPAVIETPHAVITHARLDPTQPLEDQDPYYTAAVGGPSVQIDTDEHGVPLWFRKTHIDKPICIGHVGYFRVELVAGQLYALDTGACRGGTLTAVVFPGGSLTEVNVQIDYHARALQQWRLESCIHEGDRRGWPLKHCGAVLATPSEDQPEIVAAQERIHSRLQTIASSENTARWASALNRRFGSLPPSGPERGTYFKAMNHCLTNKGIRNLAKELVYGRPITPELLIKSFPSTKLQQLEAEIKRALTAESPGRDLTTDRERQTMADDGSS